jgi:flagellar hook-length control protein FliK
MQAACITPAQKVATGGRTGAAAEPAKWQAVLEQAEAADVAAGQAVAAPTAAREAKPGAKRDRKAPAAPTGSSLAAAVPVSRKAGAPRTADVAAAAIHHNQATSEPLAAGGAGLVMVLQAAQPGGTPPAAPRVQDNSAQDRPGQPQAALVAAATAGAGSASAAGQGAYLPPASAHQAAAPGATRATPSTRDAVVPPAISLPPEGPVAADAAVLVPRTAATGMAQRVAAAGHSASPAAPAQAAQMPDAAGATAGGEANRVIGRVVAALSPAQKSTATNVSGQGKAVGGPALTATAMLAPPDAPLAAPALAASVPPQAIQPSASGLAAAVTAMHQSGQSGAVLRLDPPGLGQLAVHVALAPGGLVNVLFIPSSQAAGTLLQTNLGGLGSALAQSGLSLGQAQIGGQFNQSAGQGGYQPPGYSAAAPRGDEAEAPSPGRVSAYA